MPDSTIPGLVSIASQHTVDEVVEKLKSILAAKGITLFAVVDHSGEAAEAGFIMPTTKLVLFGNPKAGTPLMLAAPSSAIDLPLKILVAQGADGQTLVSWNSPQSLGERHGIPADLLANISGIEALAKAAAV